MTFADPAPLSASHRHWLLEAEITSGPRQAWVHIAVSAPSPDAALRRAGDHLGAKLAVLELRPAGGDEPPEQTALLARLSDERPVVCGDPRPKRGPSNDPAGDLVIATSPPPAPDASGFALLPEAIRNPRGRIYAVLDGASVFGLAERLETSGLWWKCLFQGEAAEIHAGAAPYLVELRPDNRPTAKLLGTIKPEAQGRDASPLQSGMVLSSPLAPDAVWRHLRKFTMIEDRAAGKRVYFRFFDPLVFRTLVVNLAPQDLAVFCKGISAMAALDAEGGFATIGRQGEPAGTLPSPVT